MPSCIDYNCSPLGDHERNACNEKVLGGGDSVAFIHCDAVITDYEDETQLQNAINDGYLTILKGVKVGLPAGSPITVGPYVANETEDIVNYNRTGTLIDANYNQDNITLYDSVFNGKVFKGALIRLADASKVIHVDAIIKVEGSVIVPDDSTDAIRFEATFKWKSKEMGNLYSDTTGLFD